eukprot:CAMPEP_0206565336 /NCGR_PEP_ID=MMETSP0325_2-20121206/24013_1 /ASSEMBLY_ACC=CAM_ASM_000347 /TAXON_ID=2866 /ORGANISM="Crypthecodinium cohnii, Strain Seligo" /LENGTH=145 /DNA_ID=CAMNT_0054068177 /DNA_START=41 /DNA_END=479 /DNA_ORIENTATION=+
MKRDIFLQSLVVAVDVSAPTLPVFLNDEFEFFEDISWAITSIFRTIAVRFCPKDHFALLKMQVESITKRTTSLDSGQVPRSGSKGAHLSTRSFSSSNVDPHGKPSVRRGADSQPQSEAEGEASNSGCGDEARQDDPGDMKAVYSV